MKMGLMKYLVAGSIALFAAANVHAQETTTAGEDIKSAAAKSGKAVKKTAKKVGNKTAEVASKGKAAVVDKKYAGKQGPDGQTIYIDGQSKYYYIDKKGHKQYLSESQLKVKTN